MSRYISGIPVSRDEEKGLVKTFSTVPRVFSAHTHFGSRNVTLYGPRSKREWSTTELRRPDSRGLSITPEEMDHAVEVAEDGIGRW